MIKTYKLSKDSSPGWTKSFKNLTELLVTLEKCICNECKTTKDKFPEGLNSWEYENAFPVDYGNFNKEQKILTLLDTSCGCEYSVCNNTHSFLELWI
jgi:hypothetical protein